MALLGTFVLVVLLIAFRLLQPPGTWISCWSGDIDPAVEALSPVLKRVRYSRSPPALPCVTPPLSRRKKLR
jgi:hypothetical protein